jgi:adenylosuccinate synthase
MTIAAPAFIDPSTAAQTDTPIDLSALGKLGNTSIIGLQWGDEGKGKIIDLLAGDYDLSVRWNGGSNAGHKVEVGEKKYRFHLIPIGILRPRVTCVIASGVVIDPIGTLQELDGLIQSGVSIENNLKLSANANVVLPYHKMQDALSESSLGDAKIGTTARGIGPAYADKANRSTAIRLADLLDDARLKEKLTRIVPIKNAILKALYNAEPLAWEPMFEQFRSCGEQLRPYITDTTRLLHEAWRSGQKMLLEGANAVLLDVDHGTVPFVTSSNCGTGLSVGTGLPAKAVDTTLGIIKAYSTRVGAGPFPTELNDAIGDGIRKRGHEYGTTTGRPRRCGWIDAVALRYSIAISGATMAAVMLLDVLSGCDEIKICTGYQINGDSTDWFPADAQELSRAVPVYETLSGWREDITRCKTVAELPAAARRYLERLEHHVAIPLKLISVGPMRHQTLVR